MFALFFLFGVSLALQLANLPSVPWLFLILPLVITLFKFPKSRVYLAMPFGFLWVIAHGTWILSSELPTEVIQKDLLIKGKIVSLPEKNTARNRFILDVHRMEHQGVEINGPRRIRISWYGRTPTLHVGQQWQLLVRLKPAHGMQNSGGFDYEKWLFERRIRATGYVRKSDLNILLRTADQFTPDNLRETLKASLQKSLPNNEFRGIIMALSIGDRDEITDAQWRVLTATGTNHLVAISGLHIGLVAGGAYFLFSFLFKRVKTLLLYVPAHKAAALMALIAALVYAMLAGFALPTQRALLMIAVVIFGTLTNRRFGHGKIISFALIAVLLMDPFSVLSTGFWLSFLAVAAIFYAMQGRLMSRGLWWRWGRVQWIISLALIPILLFSFQSFSIISPLANIIAVPWVSFITVPLVLGGVLFAFFEPMSQFLLMLASGSLHGLWIILTFFAELEFSQWQQFSPRPWTLLPAFIGVLLAVAPRGFPARYLSIIFLLPLFYLKPEELTENEIRFYLLDVGQGLSAVVQTKRHILVFDTGPKFRSGFNTGDAVILPFLNHLGVNKLDILMISHGDNDHIGGMQSIVNNISVDQVITGDTTAVMKKMPNLVSGVCESGKNWEWDGVEFEIIHPSGETFMGQGNNGSCVLRVSLAERVILLTGDIEKQAEKYLLDNFAEKIQANILIAPHHGSDTSSTAKFISVVNPQWVWFPTGYRNRFNFPASRVVERYKNAGVQMLTTAKSGAISVYLDQGNELLPMQYRLQHKRFWHQSFK